METVAQMMKDSPEPRQSGSVFKAIERLDSIACAFEEQQQRAHSLLAPVLRPLCSGPCREAEQPDGCELGHKLMFLVEKLEGSLGVYRSIFDSVDL